MSQGQFGHTRANKKNSISSVVFSDSSTTLEHKSEAINRSRSSFDQTYQTSSPVQDENEPVLFIPQSWELSRDLSDSSHSWSSALKSNLLPRVTSNVVDNVLKKCKIIDAGVTLASATYTNSGETLVRVRTGATGSVTVLQQAIDMIMPLTSSDIIDSPLDGTCEISVIVPRKENEIKMARNLVRKRVVARMLGHAGFFCFLFGLAAWIVGLVEEAGSLDKREL